MGYFPNGTSGEQYEAEFCNHCIHQNEDTGCPVMNIHLLYNYDQLQDGQENLKQAMDILIPRPDIHSEQCSMFIRKEV
jgi:hypothetical protein